MNDHIADENLAAYVDGALQGAAKAELESHLSRCPECLAALAEIVDIQGSAVKIPGEFLRLALGKKPSPAKAVPPLRLVLGIAAVFLVAIVVGYFFIGRERVDMAGGAEKAMPQTAVSAQDHRSSEPAAGAAQARKETAARTSPAQEAQAEAAIAVRREKKSAAAEAKPVQPAAPPTGKTIGPAPMPEKPERLQAAADAKDLALPREAEGGAVGGVLGGVEAPQEKDKENAVKSAAAPAAPGARAENLSKNAEGISRMDAAPGRSKGAALEAGGPPRSRLSGSRVSADAMQLFLAVTGLAAAPPAVEIMGPARRPAMRIAGDVSRSDLSDPGLLDSWSWFPPGLALELDIDAAGMVVAVVPVGPWDGKAAARAEAAARELRFPASGRKSRRAVVTVSAPPN
jgi:hypothetical protein